MKKILYIISLVLFLAGVTTLVLNFVFDKNIYLFVALGATGVANILLFIINIINVKEKKKIK